MYHPALNPSAGTCAYHQYMPSASNSRLHAVLGFGMAWLLASLPPAVVVLTLDSHAEWLHNAYTSALNSMNWIGTLELLGLLLLRLGGSVVLGLAAGLLLLLPLLSTVWNGILGVRRSPMLGLKAMLWPAALHSLLTSAGICLVLYIYVAIEGFSGISQGLLPYELMAFFIASLGAWTVLPHAVDNLSPEWGLFAGSLGGLLGVAIVAPLAGLASRAADPVMLTTSMLLASTIAGMFVGLLLPWLLSRDRPFWLEVEQDGRVRSFRLGRRPLLVGNVPHATARIGEPLLPLLRISLSGLTIYLEEQGKASYSVVNPPLRIRRDGLEIRLRSFDESDEWTEWELGGLPDGPQELPKLPDEPAAEQAGEPILPPAAMPENGGEPQVPDKA